MFSGSENPTVLHHWSRITALTWSCDSPLIGQDDADSPPGEKLSANQGEGGGGRSLLIGRADGSVALFEKGSLEEMCHVSRENGRKKIVGYFFLSKMLVGILLNLPYVLEQKSV